MYHPLVSEKEGVREGLGTAFSLEVSLKTDLLLKFWGLIPFEFILNFFFSF